MNKENSLVQKFQSGLKAFSFLKPKSHILIACSGGADSVALVYLCSFLPPQMFTFSAAHFNHGLRKQESRRDEDFVRNLAKKLKWKFFSAKAQNLKAGAKREKKSLEEIAREQRYKFLMQTATKNKAQAVFLAHHQNDQAETILMRMIQGTGLRGLLGIRAVLKKEKILFCRPLLNFSRYDLEEFLKSQKIIWRQDSSNKELQFLRNKIRLKLLPWIEKEMNPSVVSALARIPAILIKDNEFIESCEAKAWKEVWKSSGKGRLELKRAAFLKQPEAIQFRLFEKALKSVASDAGLNFNHWATLKYEITNKHYRAHLPKGVEIIVSPTLITLFK